jgi:Zn finger protein HypA/HybF involved in hydrogenase expression
MTMNDPDALTLDGNAIAGLLGEILAVEATRLQRTCASCHERHPLAAHRAYRSAGVVLRCPACGDTALVIGTLEHELAVQLRGTLVVPLPG